jgi:hypothetical protein
VVKFVRVRFTVTVPFPPCVTDNVVGLSDRVYELAGAAVTVRLKFAETEVTPAPLPVTVSVYVPAGTVDATESETETVVIAPFTCTLVGTIVTPAGAPVTVAVGVPVKPPVAVTVAVTVVEAPCTTLALVGLSAIVIAGVGVVVLSLLEPHACPASTSDANNNA